MDKLSVRPLSAELAEKAKTELNENPTKIADDLKALRSWLSKQPHINARKDDQFLIAFLRSCKYSLERAKEKIDMFYMARLVIPEVFQSRDVTPKLQEILKLGLLNPLRTVDDKTGARLILTKPFAYDPNVFAFMDVLKVLFMIADMLIIDDDGIIICGQNFVVDLQGISFGHIVHLTPSLIKKVTSVIQKAYPSRLKGVHFINVLPIIDTILMIFQSFLSAKARRRIFIHDSLEALHKHISKDVLPNEYGGTAGTVESIEVEQRNKVVQRREWFREDEQYKTDESKRPGTSRITETFFGTIGSFRTLDFD